MSKKIVFCDCDGPLIPTGCYGVTSEASNRRACMSTSAIGYVNILLEHSGAKLVTNSSHNFHDVEWKNKTNTLRDDLIRWGMKEEYFHDDWRTQFGFIGHVTLKRGEGIADWLRRNGEHQWVCFDDECFTEDRRLVMVDFDSGITKSHIDKAASIFKIKLPPLI